MHYIFALFAATVLTLSLPLSTSVVAETSNPDLKQIFQNPPDAAKPMVRWWWFGPAVEKPEILRELQQMKADGIGGVELAFVYPEVVDSQKHKNLPFLSPQMLDCVKYAQQEAGKLGLRVDVTMGSGWPYGGPATSLTQAATRLKTLEISVPAFTSFIAPPHLSDGESIISAALVQGDPKHWTAASAQPININKAIPPSATPRTALVFIQSHTLQQVKRASVGAEGYVLDPFSREAVANHLHSVGEPLVKAFGPTPPYAVFSDSLEAYGADWTPNLPQEFERRRGYDLLPHLPELVAGGTRAAEQIRHDYGVTLTELVNENYLTQINDWAKAHDTRFRSQTYGEPAVSFSSQNLAALPEGEGPQWRAFSTLRWATSANHVFGNNVSSGETFTWLHSPVFRATPLDMKAEADIDFIMGENQLIFHGWPYSPPASQLTPGDPGWSLYAAAALNDHNPWHPVMPAVTAYIARISALLRQGQPANQVAILLPTDDAWAGFVPGKVTVTGAMQKLLPNDLIPTILSAGYNFDFIDAEAINKVGLAKYQILVIPPTDRIPVETLHKISDWAKTPGHKNGTSVICVSRCPSLDPQGKPLPGMTGYFQLASTPPDLPSFLHEAAKPDLQLTPTNASSLDQIGFIRRKLPDADIYFVVNTGNDSVDLTATFATTFTLGEALDPDTGSPVGRQYPRTSDPSARLVFPGSASLHLAPYESRVFIFNGTHGDLGPTRMTPPNTLADLSTAWQVNFPILDRTVTEPTLTDWTADPATAHYSGEAVYTRTFNLPATPTPATSVFLQVEGGKPLPGAPNSPPEHPALLPNDMPDPRVTRTGPGMHAYYDPPIREAALVTINGQPAGALWHPPYRLDITNLLKPGQNHVEIHVYNTALNAWAALPPHDYGPLKAKYGDRFQMQDLNKVEPLPSGILGTIHLVTEGPTK